MEVGEQLEAREHLEDKEQEDSSSSSSSSSNISRVFRQLHLSREEGWSRGMCEQD